MTDRIDKDDLSSQPDLFASDERQMKAARSHAVLYCDGASSGNPGHAGIGAFLEVISSDEQYRISEYIGIATNNVAEYTALIKGLEKALSLGIKRLDVFLDSELIVRQLKGVYKVKNKNLLPLFAKSKNYLDEFDLVNVSHVRRELNQEADNLARKGAQKRG
jgi:ribonuclease HI